MNLRILKLNTLSGYLLVLGLLFLTTCQSRVESVKFSTAINSLATDASMIPGNFVTTTSTGYHGKVKITAHLQHPPKSNILLIDENGYYLNPELNAKFPGGENRFEQYLTQHFNNKYSNKNSLEIIEIDFTIDEDGNLRHVSVPANKPGFDLADESIEILLNMPAWVPARQQDKPVKTHQKLFIEYKFGSVE